MSSMPESTKPSINEAIVEAAMLALRPFYPKTAEQAADMLLFWIRRDELTEADIAEVGERMFPKPVDRMPCPAWCDFDHSREFQPNEIDDLVDHYQDLLEERDDSGRLKLWVAIHATDNLSDRVRHGAGIHVQTDETLTPAQARRMVTAVRKGLRIIA